MVKIVLRYRLPENNDIVFSVDPDHPVLYESAIQYNGKTFIYQNDPKRSSKSAVVFYELMEDILDISDLVPNN